MTIECCLEVEKIQRLQTNWLEIQIHKIEFQLLQFSDRMAIIFLNQDTKYYFRRIITHWKCSVPRVSFIVSSIFYIFYIV